MVLRDEGLRAESGRGETTQQGSVVAGPLPLSHIKECRLETEGKGNYLRDFKEERMRSDLYKKAHFGCKRMD